MEILSDHRGVFLSARDKGCSGELQHLPREFYNLRWCGMKEFTFSGKYSLRVQKQLFIIQDNFSSHHATLVRDMLPRTISISYIFQHVRLTSLQTSRYGEQSSEKSQRRSSRIMSSWPPRSQERSRNRGQRLSMSRNFPPQSVSPDPELEQIANL